MSAAMLGLQYAKEPMTMLVEAAPTSIKLPSGRVAHVRTRSCQFLRWPANSRAAPLYFKSGQNPKPVVDLDGEPLFPELAVLRLLEMEGWTGVWADTFGPGRFLRAWSEPPTRIELNDQQLALLARVPETKGLWDIFAWRDTDVLFADAKWRGKDKSTRPQLRWMEAALNSGF